jgi:hypothetical protein
MADPVLNTKLGEQDGSVKVFTWTLTSADPTGTAVELPEWADRTIQMSGTWGTATGAVQGSNDNTTFFALNNAAGATTLGGKTADFLATIIELPRYLRPNLTTPGAGATITATLIIRRANPMRT